MTTLYPLTAAAALTNLRTDLSDPTPVRWQDTDLNRAIDRANERFSHALPLLRSTQQNVYNGGAIYAYPAGAYYIDKIEYPVGNWPRSLRSFLSRRSPTILPPQTVDITGIAIAAGLAGSGSIPSGNHQWTVTFTSPGSGETTKGISSASVLMAANGSATLTGIPIGPKGTSGRNIYRATDSITFKLAGSIADNITGTFVDTISDVALGAAPPASNSTGDIDVFEMQLPPELWPSDITKIIEITYAAKHTLDTTGTTIPERHWDALYLGSIAFAMHAYLPQVNDNFMYADGHLRDRVDDTKSTEAWHEQCFRAMADFEKRLTVIREEANQSIQSSQMTQWGDVPLRWQRL
jgi:hypothetical protein